MNYKDKLSRIKTNFTNNSLTPGKFTYFPRYSYLLFILLMLALSVFYNYHEIISLRPQSIHQWRQTDCLSFTTNYYHGNSFFQPSVHNLGDDGSGKTASDFPLIYYMVGQLWKIFGPGEYMYRLLVIILSFTGLFALFKSTERILKDSLWALSIVLILFTSSTLVYYTNNFLMNVPAFAFALGGWYFFLLFYRKEQNKYLYFSMILFGIGGLLKTPSTISYIAISGVFLLEWLNIYRFKEAEKIFKTPLKQFIPFLIPLVLIVPWYIYAQSYNKEYIEGFFLIGTLPAFGILNEDLQRIFTAVRLHLKGNYFSHGMNIFLFLSYLFVLFHYKKINKFLLAIIILLSIGLICFVTLFTGALEHHDYYIINMLILVPFILLTLFLIIKKNYVRFFHSPLLRLAFLIFIIHNIGLTNNRIEERYSEHFWMNENRTKHTYVFENLAPYLDSIGIKKDDKVLCVPDLSINITLYLIDQHGWTSFGNTLSDSLKISDRINMGAKYLIYYDETEKLLENFEPFLGAQIGQLDHVRIFELFPSDEKTIE